MIIIISLRSRLQLQKRKFQYFTHTKIKISKNFYQIRADEVGLKNLADYVITLFNFKKFKKHKKFIKKRAKNYQMLLTLYANVKNSRLVFQPVLNRFGKLDLTMNLFLERLIESKDNSYLSNLFASALPLAMRQCQTSTFIKTSLRLLTFGFLKRDGTILRLS